LIVDRSNPSIYYWLSLRKVGFFFSFNRKLCAIMRTWYSSLIYACLQHALPSVPSVQQYSRVHLNDVTQYWLFLEPLKLSAKTATENKIMSTVYSYSTSTFNLLWTSQSVLKFQSFFIHYLCCHDLQDQSIKRLILYSKEGILRKHGRVLS
jgi:hypothetical protein